MKYISKNKLLKLTVLLFFIFNLGVGQNSSDNHRKYWWYKSRLNNDFVKIGTGDGESMPFNQRGLYANDFNESNPKLNIGDGTSTLGNYIAMLATEYELLRSNSQSTNKVKHELFCALNAINRLDAKAEHPYPYATQTPLNGFFIRDDISSSLLQNNYEHFNYYNNGVLYPSDPNSQNSRGFLSKFNGGAKSVRSDWQRQNEDNIQGVDIFESQDQAYNLLFGLAFINKFVDVDDTDNGAVFGYGSGETKLVTEAKNITKRIVDHLRDPKDLSGSSCNGNFATGWHITNPYNCNIISLNSGGNATAFAYPLAEIACLITNGYSSNNGSGFSLGTHPHLCPGNGFHNTWSNTGGYLLWNTIASSPLPTSNDNRLFVENLSAVCNCVYGSVADKVIDKIVTWLAQSPWTNWLGIILSWVWHIFSAIVSTFIPGFMINNTSTAIEVNAYSPNAPFDHGPLARKVLHGGYFSQNPSYTIPYLLNVMPCDGVYFFDGGQYGHWQWSSSDRLDHPERRGGDHDWRGEYNAIDYMLYHNLWYIHQKQSGISQNVTNLSDININQPTGLTCSNVNAYETITSNNTNIGCSNPTYWRAGKTIYFGAGTNITGNGSSTSGPNFHAYIQKFDCATDLGTYRLAQTDSLLTGKDSIRALNNEVTIDSYEAGAQYHHVNYPKDDVVLTQTVALVDKHYDNLITELPTDPLDEIEAKMLDVYPNYSKEFFVKPTVTETIAKAYFKLEAGEHAYLTVTDMKGSIIYFFNNIQENEFVATIDLTNHAAGTYLLKFTTTKGTSKTQKIIKQ